MTVIIRNYKKSDYSALKANLQLANLYQPDMDTESLIARMIKKDPQAIVIAEDKKSGLIVGSAYFIDMGFAAMLWRLNVIPTYRKKGIGHKLILEVKKRAKKRGFTQIHFTVRLESELIGWYESVGAWKGNTYRWMGFDL